MKISLIIISIFVLIISIIGSMFIFKLCPPDGPWPTPPWCKNSPSKLGANNGEIIVSVPYWTQGDVYLGVKDNATYLKLDKIDNVTFEGEVSLKKGTPYYYSLGTIDTKSQNAFTASGSLKMDAVIDWKNSNKEINMNNFQNAVTFGSMGWNEYRKQYTDEALDALDNLNIGWIVIIPDWFIYPNNNGTEIKPFYGKDKDFPNPTGWITPTLTDDELKYIINKANAKGIKIILKPHVDPINFGMEENSNRVNLHPDNWDDWFENYQKFILHYANLAQEENIDVLVVGTELDSSIWEDSNSEAHWRKIIAKVREVYSGKLTYSLGCYNNNCNLPSQIKFWDNLDYIGLEPYFGVTNVNNPTIKEIKTSFDTNFKKYAKPLYEKYNKPILLTEVNIYSYDGANKDPIAPVSPNAKADHQEQAEYYEALFQSIEDKNWIQGVYLWSWYLDAVTQKYDKQDVGDSFFNKPAGQVIRKWYGKIEE